MDIQKTMEFILEQHAATSARLERVSEAQDRLQASQDRLQKVVEAHEEDLATHTEWMTSLSQALQDLAGQMKHGFSAVAEAQKHTDENLNILVRTVQDILPRLPRQ